MNRLLVGSLAILVLGSAAPAQVPVTEFAARRAALGSKIADGVLVAIGAQEPQQDYLSFFQSSPFRYLTGLDEPGAALVMIKRGQQLSAMLFVEPRDPAAEVWTGYRLGPEGATKATGIPARENEALRSTLDSLLTPGTRLYVVADLGSGRMGGGSLLTADDQFVQTLRSARPGLEVVNATRFVDQIRGKKSDAELDLIRKAVDITVAAHQEVATLIEPGLNEFEAQALIEYTFRRNGAERTSFSSIVGSGPNSTVLHYNADDRFMQNNEVVVIDIGASYRGYAADVTRTYPVNGTFTPDQRLVYQIVRDAQTAAERQAKPGARAQAMTDSSTAVLAAGLARLGLIESASATYDCAGQPGMGGRVSGGGGGARSSARSTRSTTCMGSGMVSASTCTIPISSTSPARSTSGARSRWSLGSMCARTCSRRSRQRLATRRSWRSCVRWWSGSPTSASGSRTTTW